MYILIVDDEPSILKIQKREIEKFHLSVITATSGDEALHILQEEKIDILLTDLKMPGMDGLELISIASQYQSDLQCIVMSGYGQKPDTIKALQLGVIDFLEKPIDFEDLKKSIDKALFNLDLINKKEKEKKEHLKEIELLVNVSNQGLFGLDADGKISFINMTATEMLGKSQDQLIGKDFYTAAYFARKDGPPLSKSDCPIFAAIRENKTVQGSDYFLWVKDQDHFPVTYVSTPILVNGKATGAIISILDTKELQKTKELLQEKEQYLSIILENMLSGIFLIDSRTRVITYANPAALSMIDLLEESVVGHECHEFICPNEQGESPVIDHGKHRHCLEKILIGKNKKQIPIIKSVIQLTLHGRRYLLENFIDISEQKKSSRELEKSRKAFDAIIDCSLDGSIIVDRQGNVQFVNRAALSILGRTKETLCGDVFGFPMTVEEITELDIVRPDGKKAIVEMRVVRTEWNDAPAFLASLRDITMQKQLEEQIKHLANHDQLTGLPNRYLLPDRMRQMISLAVRNSKRLAVFFLDLDDFKPINDNLGHDMGDMVLKETALRLIKSVRTSDTVARIGGDEFTAILYDIQSADDIINMALKLIDTINKPIQLQDQACQIGVSIGISIYPDDSDEPDKLLKYADIAMYKAKEKGKNQYCFFNETGEQDQRQEI